MSFATDAYRKIKENERLRNFGGQLFKKAALSGKITKKKNGIIEKMTPHQKRKLDVFLAESREQDLVLKKKHAIISIFISILLILLLITLFKWAFF